MLLNQIDRLPFITKTIDPTQTTSTSYSYIHRFHVKAPGSKVADFHRQATSLTAITPPPLRVKMHQVPPVLADGDEMDFTIKMGPVPIHWVARIEQVSACGFTDRQLDGPFDHWVHHHTFKSVDGNTTLVIDHINFGFRRQLWWKMVGLNMVLGLPTLFAYRGWKTRQILESQ